MMKVTHWSVVLSAFAAGVFTGIFLEGNGAIDSSMGRAVKADDSKLSQNEEWPKLASEVERLKGIVPDQAHAMTDVDYHFTNTWFAGEAQNWPLAEFYWKETLSHLRWAVRIIPIRKDAANKDVDLVNILESIEKSPFMQLGEAISQKNPAEFRKTYERIVEACYSCHKASSKPYLRPQIPQQPASRMINVDPLAKWPQ